MEDIFLVKVFAYLMSIGVPLMVTDSLMENAPFLSKDAGWIKWLGQALSVKLVRRGLSFVIPVAVASAMAGFGVLIKALPSPVGAQEWFNLIATCAVPAAVIPQLVDASRDPGDADRAPTPI